MRLVYSYRLQDTASRTRRAPPSTPAAGGPRLETLSQIARVRQTETHATLMAQTSISIGFCILVLANAAVEGIESACTPKLLPKPGTLPRYPAPGLSHPSCRRSTRQVELERQPDFFTHLCQRVASSQGLKR